ncbi:hypothetical protein [Streptomyces sp. NPDC053431]|uniref:hypothetical protein n=1 Tax=Streptomyces sp. NPDC053431 TaxID=3365703 RepID=UPI0037D1F2E2
MIIKAWVNMHRKPSRVVRAGVLSDCVSYPSQGDSLLHLSYSASGKPQPGGFRLGPAPGLATLEGVRLMLWVVDLMEQVLEPGTPPQGRRCRHG